MSIQSVLETTNQEFVEVMFPDLDGDFIEIRALSAVSTPILKFFSSPQDFSANASAITEIASAKDVYFGVCPRSDKKGSKEYIKKVFCLWVDLDAKDFEGGKEEILANIRKFPLVPTIIVDSGHGYHVYWRLKEGLVIKDPADVFAIESVLKALAHYLNADRSAAELARILRLPGTLNHKDTPPIPVSIIELNPDRQYNLTDFDFLPQESTCTSANRTVNPDGWIADALSNIKDGNRHSTFLKLIGRLNKDGWLPRDIFELLKFPANSSGFSLDELRTEVEDICRRYPNTGAAIVDVPVELPLLLCDFLRKDIPPVEYYAQDIIQKKGRTMISAAPNVGKSIFVQNLALAVASGKDSFMGKFPVSPAKILYLDLEMGESALKDRFQKMAAPESSDTLYVKYIPSLNLLEDTSRTLIDEWLDSLKIDILILDPLGNAWAGDESKQEQVGQLTAYLNTLIARLGVSIVVVHHWRKITKDFKSGGQMAAGSYKWEAWLDTHLTLEGPLSSITVSCHKNRNRPKFSPFLVKINPDDLSFEFISDFEKKYGEATLEALFDSIATDEVSVPDLIKAAKEHGGPSETTLRDLIKTTKVFFTEKRGKTHYLRKKAVQENFLAPVEEIGWEA